MRSTPLRRRLTYGVLTGGLVAGLLVPLTASAATAVCPTYTDDEGDAGPVNPATAALLQDDGLDILAVTHSTAKGVLSSTVQTVQLLETGSDNSFGDWFQVGFTVAEKVVTVRVVRDANLQGTTTTRLQVDGVTAEAVPEAVYDFEAATVTLTVKLADLEKAVGTALKGKPFSEMETLSYGYYGGPGLLFDEAVATEEAVYTVGTACGATAAKKPAASPAGSPAASASPSAGASARPSASPSGSPSASPSGSASPSASPSPEAPAPPPEPTVPVPSAGCVGFTDEAEDSTAAVGPVPFGNRPDLDLLSVTGRTTEDTLSGHLAVAELSSGPGLPFSGHRFEYEFTVGGKVIVLRASGQGVGTGLVDGSATADLSVSAVFDEVSDQVVLTVDRASLGKVLGAPLPDGAVLTKTAGRSYAQTPVTTTLADTASPEDPARAHYVVGDNECFRPRLSVTAPAQVQTSDVAFVSVALATSDGRVAKEQTVIGRVGNGRAVTAVTDAQGTATLRVPVTSRAGLSELVVRSSGEAGEGELRSSLRILVERTLLSVTRSGSGSSRTLTATLVDDDRRRLAGQKVTFAFGGRSVTATTDGNGRAVAKVPAGSAVDVAFAGRPGFLSAAKVRTTA